MITVVVPYRDNPEGLKRLIASLPKHTPVVVIDDCSEERIKQQQKFKVRRLEERGYFAGAVNAGIELASLLSRFETDYLVLNQDVYFENDNFFEYLSALKGYAIVGDGVLHHPAWKNGYVQGTCMWIDKDAWKEVGPLDEKNWPLWGGTAEWQLRACRKGYKALPLTVPGLVHERGTEEFGSSIKKLLEQQPEKKGLFIRTPPLMSVVVPCYNYGRFLPDLVSSLIGGQSSIGLRPPQSFQGFEVVLVDDQSTDNSWAIAQGLADTWKGVRAIRRRINGGTAACLNTGIRNAYGKYILTVDADDMLSESAVESFIAHLEKDQTKLYYSDQKRLTDVLGETIRTREYDFAQLLQRNMVPAGTAFHKLSWKEAGGYPEAFAKGRQDWAFAVAMGASNHCGERIPEALYYYRRHDANRSATNTNPVAWAQFKQLLERTFPRVYGGNMGGCCGSRGAAIVRTLSVQTLVPGSEGMTLVEYVGTNVGRTSLRGDVTKQKYAFKGSMRKFYVDNRDLPSVLDYIENRKYVIQIAAIPQPVDPSAVKEVVEYA